MNYKHQYEDIQQRNILINENQDKFLIEEKNISEGNILIFSDTRPIYIEPKPTYEELENQILLLTDSMAGGIL